MRGVLYAAWEIVLLLLVAGVIGLVLGWVLTKWTIGRRAGRAERQADAQKGVASALRKQNDSLERDLALARAALHDQEVELRRVRSGLVAAGTAEIGEAAAANEMMVTEATTSVEVIAARTAGDGPRHDDDLKLIRGIGPKLERLLKDMDITSFAQIARFDAADIAVVAGALGSFPKRIERDDWVGAAAHLHQETYGEPV
jgi:predicted flap endonuclease-1-like 5' DNA nuclease